MEFDKINICICPIHKINLCTQKFFKLIYVESGCAVHILNNTKTTVLKGSYFFLDCSSDTQFTDASDDFAVIDCTFVPEIVDSSLKNCTVFNEVANHYMIKYNYSTIKKTPANYIYDDKNGAVARILKAMLEELEKREPGHLGILRCKLIEIIILSMRKNIAHLPTGCDEILNFITEYTKANISQKNILGSISKKANFSTPYLSRKFKTDMGISFTEYLKRLRIKQACQLLTNTDKSIAEIALLSGYSDLKFFNSLFKEQLGITPKDFRKKL